MEILVILANSLKRKTYFKRETFYCFTSAIKCPMDDGFLLRFLRAKKFDYDRAYETLVNYYTLR
jgi:hypothetical protein